MPDMFYRNPIMPGNYPDPSICRVGDDFYMINSSFAMFPGIPIFHSRNLVDWRQIGHVLDRPSQLHLTADSMTGGIMAPTIRWHDGVFYVIGTNMCDRKNFIVTAINPEGPWSELHLLDEIKEIDPSLFFDDDGKVYVTGPRRERGGDGERQVIWAGEIDLQTMHLKGSSPTVWRGALYNAAYPEGPHLYKRNGWYYLLIAEGGTEFYHSVTVARSRQVLGPYEGYAGNPVMTHRHLGRGYPFSNMGHADLVELQDKSWYAVLLGSRQAGNRGKPMGRETFLVPVVWEEDWPVFSPGTGKVEKTYPFPKLPETPFPAVSPLDDFDGPELAPYWNFFGTPYKKIYSLSNGSLVIPLSPEPLWRQLKPIGGIPAPEALGLDRRSEETALRYPIPAFIGRRQQHFSYTIRTEMVFAADSESEAAGLAVIAANNHIVRLERTIAGEKHVVRAVMCTSESESAPYLPDFRSTTTETVLQTITVDANPSLVLEISADNMSFFFSAGATKESLTPLLQGYDCSSLFPEAGGMVGTYLGVYATSNEAQSGNEARFNWFLYEGTDPE